MSSASYKLTIKADSGYKSESTGKISVERHAVVSAALNGLLIDDAKRIIACVKACSGISTEDIETRGVCSRFDAALQFKDTGNVITGEKEAVRQVSDLISQRDELLSAMEHIANTCDGRAAEVAQAVIAKAKGGAA